MYLSATPPMHPDHRDSAEHVLMVGLTGDDDELTLVAARMDACSRLVVE